MHMTCRRAGCGYEFCWLCRGAWKDHGSATGGYYRCNRFEEAQKEGKLDEEEEKRHAAKSALDRYIHYYERFVNHARARDLCLKTLKDMDVQLQSLHRKHGLSLEQLKFLPDGVRAVARARQVLKWTYPFGYRLKDGAEKELYHFLQENLEKNVEHLHGLLEQPIHAIIADDVGLTKFTRHRTTVVNYTHVTLKFLRNLLEGIDGGLTNTATLS